MPAKLRPDIQRVLAEYTGALENQLPGLVTGLYLHGSVALGAFDPSFSDVDFLAFLSRRYSRADLIGLTKIHQVVALNYPRPVLDGGYLQWEDLGQMEEDVATYPYYHDGQLQTNGHGGVNVVTWWLVKNRGVVLFGPNPREMEFEVSGDRTGFR